MKTYVFLVTWNLFFSQNYGTTWEQWNRKVYFESQTQAQDFMKRAPPERFECVETVWGRVGVCEVKNMQWERVDAEKAKRDMENSPK